MDLKRKNRRIYKNLGLCITSTCSWDERSIIRGWLFLVIQFFVRRVDK